MNTIDATRAAGGAPLRLEAVLGALLALVSLALLATPHQALALLPAAALLGVMLLARHPAFGLYLIVALIPFWDFRTIAGSLPVHWLVAGVLVAVLVLQQALRRELPRALQCNLWIPFALFLLVGAVSALTAPHRATALSHLVRLGLAGAFLALVLVLLDRRGFERTLPAVLVWSVSISSLLAVLGYFYGIELFVADPGDDAFTRATGGARGAVNMAFLIVSVVPLIGYWLYFEPRGRRKLAAVALLLVNLIALFTTFSRAGGMLLVLVTLGMLWEFLPYFRVRHLLLLICASTVVLALALPAAPAYYWQRLGMLGSTVDKASQRRISYIIVARDAILERPVLGHGLGAFPLIYSRTTHALAYARTDEERFRWAHNTYLELLVGSGALGLAAYLLLLWAGLRNFGRAKRLLLARGQEQRAMLVSAYRLSFLAILAFLFLKSGIDNKSLLLALALSAVALRLARGPLPRPG